MFDVLPPTRNGDADAFSHKRKKRRARMLSQAANVQPPTSRPTVISSGPRVVQVNWKLPARLRKPIRPQLQKQRQEQRKKAAIVHFERRPLTTQTVKAAPAYKREVNIGAEHHTGDVYANTRPQKRVALPPYAGSFSRNLISSSHRNSRPRTMPQQKNSQLSAVRPVQPRIQPPSLRQPQTQSSLVSMERDTPFFWEGYSPSKQVQHVLVQQERQQPEVTVEAPKPALAFELKIWPFSLFSTKKKFQFQKSREPEKNNRSVILNTAVLLVGFVAVGAFMWNLQRVGQGFSVLSSVQSRSSEAYGKILTAQAAFAATDFTSGEQDLAQAQMLLQEARGELTDALSAAQYVLKIIDVTNTVSSGDKLLAAGEGLTAAGQNIARGASAFFTVDILPDEKNGEGPASHTLIDALSFARDQFSLATAQLDDVEKKLNGVGSPFLPPDIKKQVATLSEAVPKLNTFLKDFNEQSSTLLNLLGAERQRQYLVLFANNDELRPVGGFIGSVGLINVDKGKIENIDVSSVYDPDGQLKEYIAPPDPLLPITNRWYMRDANWFVDYPTSAKKIAEFFEKEGGPTVDGVIMMTPDVMKRLLEVTGPIEMPRYGVTVTADNFSVVTQGQVTYDYSKQKNKPKQFLADLTPVLLNHLLSDGKSNVQALSALETSVQQKELLLYFRDGDIEQKIKDVGWAGAVPEGQAGYLLVNNANIGGHKSDQFIEQEIDYRVQVSEKGKAEATVTVRRTHKGPEEAIDYPYPSGEDPSQKDNIVFQRVLVPKGSKLIEATGYTKASDIPKIVLADKDLPVQPDADVAAWQMAQIHDSSGTIIGQEAGYSLFANWIITKPGQTTITMYRYALPETVNLPGLLVGAKKYSVEVGKQPGAKRVSVRVNLELPSSTKVIHVVPEAGVTQENDHTVVYRGAQQGDVLVGAVFTK